MRAVSIMTHLFRALRRALGRVVLWFAVMAVVSAGTVEGVAYFAAGYHFPPSPLTNLAALALALALGYAATLTVLIGEVVRFMIATVHDSEKQMQRDLSGGQQIVDALVHSVQGVGRTEDQR